MLNISNRMKFVLVAVVAIIVGNIAWFAVETTFNQPPPPPHPDVAREQELIPIANSGNAEAQYLLAELYFHARGIPRDDERAFNYYQMSANGGHPGGQFGLGRMYELGRKVHQEFGRAAQWYRISASLGQYADAQYALGMLYFRGQGIGQSYGVAMEWFVRAANNSHAASQYLVATMYRDGWGIKENPKQAYLWFSLAGEHAAQAMKVDYHFDPVEGLRMLKETMTRVQIREAEKMVVQYKARKGTR